MKTKTSKSNFKVLLTPGPSNVPERFRSLKLGEFLEYHRHSSYYELTQLVEKQLNKLFLNKTGRTVIYSSTGTGALNAIFNNFLKPKDKVLIANIGYFGDVAANLARQENLNVHEIKVPWSQTVQPKQIEEFLKKNKDTKAVFVTHSETSTGALNDLKAIGEITNKYKVFFGVDSISGAILNPLKMTEWHIDALASASQKGFNLYPGLSFMSFSAKAWKMRLEKEKVEWYFDIKRYFNFPKGSSNLLAAIQAIPQTSAISLMFQLDQSLKEILELGLIKRWQKQKEIYRYFESELAELGFENLVKKTKDRSQSVLVVGHQHLNFKNFLKDLDEKANIIIAPALGEFNNRGMRLGLIREISIHEIDKLMKPIKKFVYKNLTKGN
ncbi:pyridoxal-phosphate-dependent aminotransferase family protein [[Mycoplasma] testudinis]|uniref:pyridoxal-phosphate-dependent aminotransferase family protein n=1 Tax=[Mycoplasma] testudinis TaxID=33924 RepID=UPI0004802DF7|nr:aminotransferase class V-fold PLP-dependent enzyme [[Mycoplasma] testudinis]